MNATADLEALVARCEQEEGDAHRKVQRFSAANWVIGLAAAGLTAAVGVSVFYDALPDAAKALLALTAALANVAATVVRAEDRMVGYRAQRAAWTGLAIDARLLRAERGEHVTPAEVAALDHRAADVRLHKAV